MVFSWCTRQVGRLKGKYSRTAVPRRTQDVVRLFTDCSPTYHGFELFHLLYHKTKIENPILSRASIPKAGEEEELVRVGYLWGAVKCTQSNDCLPRGAPYILIPAAHPLKRK